MATFYMKEVGKREWKSLPDDIDLAEFGLKWLNENAFKDSDGGYSYRLEFWRDGVTTFIYGTFDGYDAACGLEGGLNDYLYGTLEEVNAYFGKNAVRPYAYPPHRDFLLLGSYGQPGGMQYLG